VSSIRCPACGKEHMIAEGTEIPPKQTCLRCGESFPVGSGARTPEPAMARSRGSRDADRAALPDEPDTDSAPEAADDEQAARGSRKKRSRKGSKECRPFSEESVGGEEMDFSPLEPERDSEHAGALGSRRPLWPILSLLLVGGVLAGGTAWYFLSGSSEPPAKSGDSLMATMGSAPIPPASTVAPKTDTKIDQKPPAPRVGNTDAADEDDAPTGTPPGAAPGAPASGTAASGQNLPVIRLSAARLSAELLLHKNETIRKYANRTLEVTGLFDRLEKEKPKETPKDKTAAKVEDGREKARPRPEEDAEVSKEVAAPRFATFAVDGAPLLCNLGKNPASPKLRDWIVLHAGQIITVKCVLRADLQLHKCEIVPAAPPADEHYLAKEVEVVGYVAKVTSGAPTQEYPVLEFEHETNGPVGIQCFFRKSEEAVLKKLSVGSQVTLSGFCNGRQSDRLSKYFVRMDNCRLIYTTGPVPPTPRVEVYEFLRQYGEDLRPDLLPQDKSKAVVVVTAAQLENEAKSDLKALAKKYRNQFITVTGSVYRKGLPTLVLDSGTTVQGLKVHCYFTPHAFADVDDRKEFMVRGLCSGVPNPATLRLDNCEIIDPNGSKDRRNLAAEYFVRKPGDVLVYDVVSQESGGPPVLLRRAFTFLADNAITSITTHMNRSLGMKNVRDERPPKGWTSLPKTRSVSVEGPVYRYRLSGGFVELGVQLIDQAGHETLDWEPVLQLGAKAGASWNWTHKSDRHECTLLQFGESEGRPSAVIKEAITRFDRSVQYIEIRHVYVRDVGEVERQESVRLPSGQMRLVSVMRLVDDQTADSKPKTAKDQQGVRSLKSVDK
jgi:tRNA_anti-like